MSNIALGQVDNSTVLRKEITKIMEYDSPIDFNKTPGFIISILDGDSTYNLTFGNPIDSTNRLNKYSQFELGGSSKIFSSPFFIDWISNSNKLSFSTKVADLDLNIDNRYIDSLSLSQLIYNQTSFPKRPLSKFNLSRTQNPYQNYDWDNFVDFLNNTESSVISVKTAYTHINSGLIQYIYEQLTNTTFNDELGKYLLNKGIKSTNFNIDSTFHWGLNREGAIAKPWQLQIFQASEGLLSNSQDISFFLRSMMSDQVSLNRLKQKAKESIYRPSFHLTSGWSIIKGVGKFDIFAITGKTSGHSSFIAFIPETKTAVSILCNSAVGTDDLGMLILRMINNNFKREHE